MTVISSGTWPIDATTTSGTELAAYLNEMADAIQTSQASPSRPPAIQKGGVWTKTLGAADIALMLYDGTTDREIGKVVGGNTSFGGTFVSNTAPTPATAGMLWVDTTAAAQPLLKMYDGTIWQLAHGNGAAKAFVYFHQANHVALASLNISSITDSGVGLSLPNLTSAFTNANFAAVASEGGSVLVDVVISKPSTASASYLRFRASNVNTDTSDVSQSCFGELV